jgi:hypothetical protein
MSVVGLNVTTDVPLPVVVPESGDPLHVTAIHVGEVVTVTASEKVMTMLAFDAAVAPFEGEVLLTNGCGSSVVNGTIADFTDSAFPTVSVPA